MQNEHTPFSTVPWTVKDLGFSLIFMVGWVGFSFLAVYLIKSLRLNLDYGVFIAFFESFLLVPVVWFSLHRYKASWKDLGVNRFNPAFFALVLGLLILVYLFNTLYSLFVLVPLKLEMQEGLVSFITQNSISGWSILGITLIGPFTEEIFFRAFFYAGLRQKLSWVQSALISSALFSVFHLQWTAFLPMFLIGFFLALLYERSRSIWPSIFLHALINSLSLLAILWLAK